jgi:hypothetical protein
MGVHPAAHRIPSAVMAEDDPRVGGRDHLGEAAGTLAAALLWGVGVFIAFLVLGMLTHTLVAFTVGSSKAGWRVAAGAIVASLFLAAVVTLLIIIVRSAAAIPAHHRVHVQQRERQQQLRQQQQPRSPS